MQSQGWGSPTQGWGHPVPGALGDLGATPRSGYYRGGGGYVYYYSGWQAPIQIVSGPTGVGSTLSAGSSTYLVVLNEISAIGAPNASGPDSGSTVAEEETGGRFSNVLSSLTNIATGVSSAASQISAAQAISDPGNVYAPLPYSTPTGSDSSSNIRIAAAGLGFLAVVGLVIFLVRRKK